jgi:exportin-2 (importin alpha re-exporter)
MVDLSQLLLASLNPSTRKEAEASLTQLSSQPGFPIHLLRLVLNQTENKSVKLAGSVYLKNVVKARWDDVGVSFMSGSYILNLSRYLGF